MLSGRGPWSKEKLRKKEGLGIGICWSDTLDIYGTHVKWQWTAIGWRKEKLCKKEGLGIGIC